MLHTTYRPWKHKRSGIAAVYIAITMAALTGIVAIAVDLAHVRGVKGELSTVADASARAALSGLVISVPVAQTNAVAIAGANQVDGASVSLNINTDIEFGMWDANAKSLTVLTGTARASANAVRITARRTSATGNAVPVYFGSFIGLGASDVTASAVALLNPGIVYGIVGLDSVSFVQSSKSYSYNSSGAAANGQLGNIKSNGNITLTTSGSISGDANPGVSGSISGSATVTGSRTNLTAPVSVPTPIANSYSTINDNANIPGGYWSGGSFVMTGGSYTVPAGNYYVTNVSLTNTSNLNVSGKVTFWITGTLTIGNSSQTVNTIPSNLNFVVLGSGAVNLSSSNDLHCVVYAPLSDITISNSKKVYGSVVGKTLSVSNSVMMIYDEALTPQTSTSGSMRLVR